MSGYDPNFISPKIKIPLPTFDRTLGQSVYRSPDLRDDVFSDHRNFTVVLNEHTKQPVYAALNIDQSKFFDPKAYKDEIKNKFGGDFGKRGWRRGGDFPKGSVLENEYYKDRKGPNGEKIPNPYDRGHMAMRWNTMWGDTIEDAHMAGRGTFIWSNSSLQHKNLNQDEWRGLEEHIVREFTDDTNDRLSVFTGPIYGDLDRHIHISPTKSGRAPSGFFKVICFQSNFTDRDDELGVLAFAIFQDSTVLQDAKGAALVKTDRRYQMTVTEIQALTGLNFGKKLFDANPLFYFDNNDRNAKRKVFQVPERIPIDNASDLVLDASEIRQGVQPLAERRVVINSAMINPTKDMQAGEWVSLHNRSSGRITITDWVLTDRMGRKTKISGAINSGESMRITGRDLDPVKLPNRGGSLMLRTDKDILVDHVTWNRNDLKKVDKGMAYMFERGQ